MKRLIIKITTATLAVVGLACVVASATQGGSSDPLVTLSYLEETFMGEIMDRLNLSLDSKAADLQDDFSEQLDSFRESLNESPNLGEDSGTGGAGFEPVELLSGETLRLAAGDQLLVVGGSLSASGAAMSDVTAGSAVDPAVPLAENHLFISSGDVSVTAVGTANVLYRGNAGGSEEGR